MPNITIDPKVYEISTFTNPYTIMNYTNMPSWLQTDIENVLTTNSEFTNISNIVSNLNTTLDSLEDGIHHYIEGYASEVATYSNEINTIKSTFNDNVAGIIASDTTLATKDYAQTVSADLLTATFGTDAEAWATDIIAARTSSTYSTIQDYTTLLASLEDTQIKLEEIKAISLGVPYKITSEDWDNPDFEYLVGMYKEADTSDGAPVEDSEIFYQYVGGVLGEDNSGWALLREEPTSTEDWLATNSSFLTDTDGHITGWGYGDSSNALDNAFSIKASNFSIEASDSDYYEAMNDSNRTTLFASYDSGPKGPQSIFNGRVLFYRYYNDNKPSTTIDGYSIETGEIRNTVTYTSEGTYSPSIPKTVSTNDVLSFVETTGTSEELWSDFIPLTSNGIRFNEFKFSVQTALIMDTTVNTSVGVQIHYYKGDGTLINTGSASGGTQITSDTSEYVASIPRTGFGYERISITESVYKCKIKFYLQYGSDISTFTSYDSLRYTIRIEAVYAPGVEYELDEQEFYG